MSKDNNTTPNFVKLNQDHTVNVNAIRDMTITTIDSASFPFQATIYDFNGQVIYQEPFATVKEADELIALVTTAQTERQVIDIALKMLDGKTAELAIHDAIRRAKLLITTANSKM